MAKKFSEWINTHNVFHCMRTIMNATEKCKHTLRDNTYISKTLCRSFKY